MSEHNLHHDSNDKNQIQMASIQNEEDASKELNFKTQMEDGAIRNPTIKEEFVKVIKEFKILVENVFIDSISEEYFPKTMQWQEFTDTSTE